MKQKLLLAFTLLLALGPISAFADEITAKEKSAIDAELRKRVTFTPKRISSRALTTVFDATFYDVKMRVSSPDGSTSTTTMKLTHKGSAFVSIESPDTNKPMAKLQSLVKTSFKINNTAAAKTFEQALDSIYPIRSGFGDKDLKAKAFVQKGKTWTFIRGEFFKDHKGFIVTTDAKGKITSIKYSLSIKK
jgi:hypothetical protein